MLFDWRILVVICFKILIFVTIDTTVEVFALFEFRL